MSHLPKSSRLILPHTAMSVRRYEAQENVSFPARIWSQTLKYEDPISVYIHVPFCERRCPFCRFYSVNEEGEEERLRFLVALEKELLLVNSLIDFARLNIESLSIGGGTPFELSVSHLTTLLTMLEGHLNVHGADTIEYCMEINPHDVTRPYFAEKLELLRSFNVNRLSFGAQSFDDQVLKVNGSRHTATEVTECLRIAREYGFRNVNIDLLYGLTNQSRQSWRDTLQRACELHPEHISLFSLKKGIWRVFAETRCTNRRDEDMSPWIPLAERCLGDNGYIEYFPMTFVCNMKYAYKYETNTFVCKKTVLGFGPGSITWAGQFCYRNVRNLTVYKELLDSCTLPIDTNTIHYPCDNFLSRLAYF